MKVDSSSTRIEGSYVICNIRVPYADTDQMGNVYYGNYFTYFEMGRSEYMRELGHTYKSVEELGYVAAVVEAYCKYKGRTFYDDLLELWVAAEPLKGSRLRFSYKLYRVGEEELLIEGHTVHSIIDLNLKRPVRLPQQLLEMMNKLPPLEEDE